VNGLLNRCKLSLLGVAFGAVIGIAAPKPAQALTVLLDFVASPTTDPFMVTTLPESFSSWGFTGLNLSGVRNALLNAVIDDYLGYSTVSSDPLSPLLAGKELNINFGITVGQTGPTNGDSEYYYIAIGDASPNQGFLGEACLGCVRTLGAASITNGTIFGSVLTDSIASLLSLATNDTERINLLAGTLSHEIGHSLTLAHPNSALANPGASSFSLMATGAAPSAMPNTERIKDRDFAYSEFASLIQNVGLRDAVSPVPEPETYAMMLAGLLCVIGLARARNGRRNQPYLGMGQLA
jgi:PEP-CTERM motif